MIIQSPELSQAFRDETKLTLAEVSNLNASGNIQACIDVTPSNKVKIICVNGATTTSGTGTILSARAGIRYVIHGYTASIIKDATCDGADGNIQWNITQNQITRTFCSFPALTLTAQSITSSLFFDKPVICDENTLIQAASFTFTAGKCRRNIVIYVSELTN